MSFNIQAIGVLFFTLFYPFFSQNLFTNNLHKLSESEKEEKEENAKITSRPVSKSFVKSNDISFVGKADTNCSSGNLKIDNKQENSLVNKGFKSQTFIGKSHNFKNIQNEPYFLSKEKEIDEDSDVNSKSLKSNKKKEYDTESFFEESFKEEEKHILSDFKRLIFEPVSKILLIYLF